MRGAGAGISVIMLILIATAVLSCKATADRKRVRVDADSAGNRVKELLLNANSGRYEFLSDKVSYVTIAEFDKGMETGDSEDWTEKQKKRFWMQVTKNGSISNIIINKIHESGGFAVVKLTVIYKDGSYRRLEAELNMVKGSGWVLSMFKKMLMR